MNLKNILQVIRNEHITAYEIAQKTNLTEVGINKILNGTTKKPHKSTIKTLESYVNSYSKFGKSVAVDVENRIIFDKKKDGTVPYYDIDVTSHITTSFNDIKELPTFFVDYKPFNDCTAYVNNYGDSMFPKYKNGEKLAVKQIFNFDIINWGETYLVVTNLEANDLRTVKDLHYHEDESKVILRASNPSYKGDTIINKQDILSMFSVKGKISQNFI